MADLSKCSNGSLISDFKSYLSIRRTKKSVSVAYGLIFTFIAFTTFLAFTPNSNSSSSIHDFFIPKPSVLVPKQSNSVFEPTPVLNQSEPGHGKGGILSPKNDTLLPVLNQTVEFKKTPPKIDKNPSKFDQDEAKSENFGHKVGILEPSLNQTLEKKHSLNQTLEKKEIPAKSDQNQVQGDTKVETLLPSLNKTADNGKGLADQTAESRGKEIKNGKGKKGMSEVIKSLMNCDLFDGNWVRDESYPLYKPGSCSLIDEQFNCFRNGRPDNGYHKLKWKPKGCSIPRLNGRHMLKLLTGKRLVFVGDSLNRNMWESLICILKNSVKNKKKVYEQSGRYQFRTEASYSFVFEEYNSTVEFFVTPFLVQESEATDKNGTKKETLRIDLISNLAGNYKKADIIVFNTGHWWTHEKTSLGKDYYQEGNHVYPELDVDEAFRKALTTWGRWIDENVNPKKSLVFFRGYSNSHFSGGQWNSGGACDNETEPILNDKYLTEYPSKMTVLERVLQGMKTQVTYLNVTKLTDYRKDGHPSVYRKQKYSDEEKKTPLIYQDCSHWCLPGVPDSWNELLYAELLVKLYGNKQR